MNCGELATLSGQEFVDRYIPERRPDVVLRAADFRAGRTDIEAIEAALATERPDSAFVSLILDSRDWIIERAIRLPSNTEVIIDDCRLKLADGVHDNIIRSAGLRPDPENPNHVCLVADPVENIRIVGRGEAVIEGADNPYTAANPKTGVVEPWLGDFFGWRTVGIQLSRTSRYEIGGFTMRKTHCWAISQEQCSYGCLHDIVFDTHVKNGDGINFRNGCHFCMVENISGLTSDDTVACTALDGSRWSTTPNYIYPMQPMGYGSSGDAADIHDIVIRNIRTGGEHHGVICLATSPRVYNIAIEDVVEEGESTREACVKIYTGYGTGYKEGNLSNICVRNVVSRGARFAVMVKADVRDVSIEGVRQMNHNGETCLFEGSTDGLHLEDEHHAN